MEGVVGSNGTCCTMGFGESGSGLCPLTMMMPMPLPLATPRYAGHDHQLNLVHPNLNDCNADTQRSLRLLPSSNNSDDQNNESHHNIQNISDTGLGCYFMESNSQNHNSSSSACSSSVKAKIMSHPHYPRLLTAYASCQKVGAPPEVVAKLEEVSATMSGQAGAGCLGQDPALDQLMEAYCEMLIKYEQELSKPFKEAMLYFQRIECQFKALTLASPNSCNEFADRAVSAEDVFDGHKHLIDPQAEEQEIKGKLLRKYSGYLGSLKQEFMKKRKKGKLPKEARQQLLEWWSRHYKWPYPSEPQKMALAESTGLDQKQINNWFINQRKRHWKPSEDMQFVVMDAAAAASASAAHPHYYMDSVWGNPFPADHSSALV